MALQFSLQAFARVEQEVNRDTPFQVDAGLGVAQLEADPELAATIVKGFLEDLSIMGTNYCAFAHERMQGTSLDVYGEVCSLPIRSLSLTCGHGTNSPLRGVTKDLLRFGFIDDQEFTKINIVSDPARGQRADEVAARMYARANADSANALSQRRVFDLGFDVDLAAVNEGNVERMAKKHQAKAFAPLVSLHYLLVGALAAAEKQEGGLREKIASFRHVFEPAFQDFCSRTQ